MTVSLGAYFATEKRNSSTISMIFSSPQWKVKQQPMTAKETEIQQGICQAADKAGATHITF